MIDLPSVASCQVIIKLADQVTTCRPDQPRPSPSQTLSQQQQSMEDLKVTITTIISTYLSAGWAQAGSDWLTVVTRTTSRPTRLRPGS